MNEETPLLRQTIRTTALMLVPVAAFLAILSAVALFAVPSSSPASKEQRVTVAGETSTSHDANPRAKTRAMARPHGGN